MGNLINSGGPGGGELMLCGKQNSDKNAAFLAFLRVLRGKSGKNQPRAQVPGHLK